MKKAIATLLALMLLSGCSTEKPAPNDSAPPQPETTLPQTTTAPQETPPEPELENSVRMEVLSCSFKEQILPTDFESYMGWFPAVEGKVYVDLKMWVENTGEAPIGEDHITGWFEYQGKRVDMQFEVEADAGDFENENKTVPPGAARTAHLFYTVDAAAEGTVMEVHYSVLGQENQIQVDDDVPPVLEDKMQLKIGESFGREGNYVVEVLDCLISDSLRATGDGAVKYYVENHEVFDLILKVSNKGDADLRLLEGYLLLGQETEFACGEIEINDGKELEAMSIPIAPGEEAIVHLWVAVPMDTPADGMLLRFNVQGDSFYCYAVG